LLFARPGGKAAAVTSTLCLFFHYAGSSLAGSIGGWVFASSGWPEVAAFVGVLPALALAVTMKVARFPPPAHLRAS
jgi:YNFM family putative membrane transporter